jgi:hypothetical protein
VPVYFVSKCPGCGYLAAVAVPLAEPPPPGSAFVWKCPACRTTQEGTPASYIARDRMPATVVTATPVRTDKPAGR